MTDLRPRNSGPGGSRPPGNICFECRKNLGPYSTQNRCDSCEKKHYDTRYPNWRKSRRCIVCKTV